MAEDMGRIHDMSGREADFYRNLFASLDNNAVLRMRNAEGVFVPVSCTREFTEMMECTPEEFIRAETEEPLSTVIPEDRAAAAYLLENKMARDGKNHVTVRKKTMKGHLIWVDLHYSIFEHGGVRYAYCNYYNITNLKENERLMRLAHEELTKELKAISNESLAVIRSNLSMGIVEEISGHDLYEGDHVGAKIEDLIRVRLEHMPMEADRRRYVEHFSIERCQDAYERGEDIEPLVLLSQRQSGKICFVRYSAGMRKDPMTGDVTIFGIETEYNSEKVNEILNEKVLAKQYDMISYLMNGNYGVVIGDEKNIAKGSIFPREKNGLYMDYITQQVAPVIHGTQADAQAAVRALAIDTVDQALAQSDSYTVPVACDIDGEVFYKRFTFYVVDRVAKFYILLKADYTELQREQTLYNEQLRKALEEANQANVAKTAFLSSMSHEIRTPMNAIIGLDNIALSEPKLPERTKNHLEQIGASARHLLALINDILDMSRIESGRMVLKSEDFSVSKMLEEINTMIGGQCRDKHLHYDCAVRGRLNEYYIGDDMKLKQVLINILGNAVKFTPAQGRVTLDVECTKSDANQSVLCFTITDSGIGMDEEYLPKLFTPFSQEDATTTNAYGGTGLGLAITKHIVELMNGSITVSSRKGEGSVFTVCVTLANSKRTELSNANLNPRDMNVLVIDDDPVACEHAKLVLEEVGISVETCLSGEKALEAVRIRRARREEYNLILVDLHMPGQDGIEVTRRIRELVGFDTAIIILTAYNWDDVMDQALQAGVDSFMAKPLFSATVMDEFSKAIEKKKVLAKKTPVADFTGRHILLVEDVEINAAIMEQLLIMKNMMVDRAQNGQVALDMFANSPEGTYDAILMDIRMPVMDGLTAARAIRALDRRDAGSVPIIALTANAFDEDVQRSLMAGMNAHLSKPIEPEKMYQTMAEFMK